MLRHHSSSNEPCLEQLEHERAMDGEFAAFHYSDSTASCILIKHVDILYMHRPNARSFKALVAELVRKGQKSANMAISTSDLRPGGIIRTTCVIEQAIN